MDTKTFLLAAVVAGGVYLMLRGARPAWADMQLSPEQRAMLEAQEAAFYGNPSNSVLSK